MQEDGDLFFWLRWVAANALGEALGLGATFLIGAVFFAKYSEMSGLAPALLVWGVSVGLGAFEGLVVGLAQGRVLRRRLPGLPLRRWTLATIAGALLAWSLAMIPITVMNAAPAAAAAPAQEPSQGVVTLLAMAMGAVAGMMLAVGQWFALRRYVRRAGFWLPANGLAWAVGLPFIFAAIDRVPSGATALAAGLVVLAGILVAGALVGAVHGLVLVRGLLRRLV